MPGCKHSLRLLVGRSWLAACAVGCCFLCASAQTPPAVLSRAPALDATARLVGVQNEISRLHALSVPGAIPDRWQMLSLHQRIYERITAVSLQVDATMAQIDNEVAQANEIRGYLADRRDRRVNRANLLGIIVGGGLGATSSGLQLSSALDKPAAGVGIGAGALSAGFGVAGIRAQQGETARFNFNSNMLAELFDQPVLPDSHYPATIAAFLDEQPLSNANGQTRKQQLIQTWLQVKRIDSLNSTGKIEHVTSQPSAQARLSIDDFEDRAAMLQDLRARISFLKRDLGALLASLPPMTDQKSQEIPSAQ